MEPELRRPGISFEDFVFHFERGHLLDMLEHLNPTAILSAHLRRPTRRLEIAARHGGDDVRLAEDAEQSIPFHHGEQPIFRSTIICAAAVIGVSAVVVTTSSVMTSFTAIEPRARSRATVP